MAAQLLQEAAMLVVRQATTFPTATYPYATGTTGAFATGTAASAASASPTSMAGMPAEKSFFEEHKTIIIGAAIGLPLQIVLGYFYWRRRNQKKAAAAIEKENLEARLKELEMAVGNGGRAPVFGQAGGYEQRNL